MACMSVTVTRAELGLPDLVLPDTNLGVHPGAGWGPPARSWRKSYATSPVAHGRVPYTAVLDGAMLQGDIVVVTTVDTTDFRTGIETVTAAFSQYAFDVTLDVDGVVYSYRGEAADWVLADWGSTGREWHKDGAGTIRVNIPVYPVPLVGGLV